MGIDIYGWLEVYHDDADEWQAVLNFGPIITRNYDLQDHFFDQTGHHDGHVPHEGMPEDATLVAEVSMQDLWGCGWITWDVIAHDWLHGDRNMPTAWSMIGQFADAMASSLVDGRKEHVRFVFGFS